MKASGSGRCQMPSPAGGRSVRVRRASAGEFVRGAPAHAARTQAEDHDGRANSTTHGTDITAGHLSQAKE
jgi:hypothetical protein